MIRSAILSTAAIVLALGTSAAIAQQTPTVRPSAQSPQQAVAPQVWTPTYVRDASGALWLVYVPSAPVQYQAPARAVATIGTTQTAAPARAVAPVGANQTAAQAPPSMVSPHNRELGTGRAVRMHKPWMSGRR